MQAVRKGFCVQVFASGATVGPMSIQVSDYTMAKVAILMCTYNGASFLAEQLRSFERQTHRNWTLHVSDDGSSDGTLELLQTFSTQGAAGRFQLVDGPQRGFVANFLSLTCRTDIDADFYAWSDQDDIWHDDKLQVALSILQSIPGHIPAIYCGRTELISESGFFLGLCAPQLRQPSFANALVQSIGGGNTMVFNKAACELLQEAGAAVLVASHDWWAYQLISGVGGFIYYDPIAKVKYRQHASNQIGSNSSWRARYKRIRMVFNGRFCEWNAKNIPALERMRHRLNKENEVVLMRFKSARNKLLPGRVFGVIRAGLYRQTRLGSLGLILATIINKI